MAYRGRGRGRGANHVPSQPHNSHNNFSQQPPASSNSSQLAIKGWLSSKLSSTPDQGYEALIQFLNKKAGRPIHSHKRVGAAVVIITINPEDAPRFYHLNGFTFAGAQLIVEEARPPRNQQQTNGTSSIPTNPRADRMPIDSSRASNGTQEDLAGTAQVESLLITAIRNRYNAGEKFLSLHALALEPDFQASGLSQEPAGKVFKALFTILERKVFETPSKRQEMVHSVSLANNSLTSVKDVLSLSNTFPHLKNLDLSNNMLEDTGSIRFWKNQFRDLEHIILTNNPVAMKPDTKEILLSWYPKLKFYNNEQVRTDSGQILNSATTAQAQFSQPINSFSQPTNSTIAPNIPKETLPTAPHPEFPDGSLFAVPTPDKPEDQLMKEQMGLRFSFETKLKMEYVEQALAASAFNYDIAMQKFKEVQMQGSIPPEAYIPGV